MLKVKSDPVQGDAAGGRGVPWTMRPITASMPVMTPGRWPSILAQRCPRCRSGAVFGGLVSMNETCPGCGLRFEREAGYFLGAMYFSYGLGLIAVAGPVLALFLATELSISTIGWIAGLELLALSPWLFRYSRVLWLHLDEHVDPATDPPDA
jgi:uncharacterized protein (DUF983 family)